MMNLRSAMFMSFLALCASVSSAQADYILSLETATGGISLEVEPGGSFDIYARIASDSSDATLMAALDVAFSVEGLEYTGYTWLNDVAWGVGEEWSTANDVSSPAPAPSSPVTLAASSYVRGYEDPGLVDIYFGNLTKDVDPRPAFSEGLLVEMSFILPSSWSLGSSVDIWTVPRDGFYEDIYTQITTTSGTAEGSPLTVTATPEPATACLALLSLCFGGAFAHRRRGKGKQQ